MLFETGVVYIGVYL